MINKLHPSTFSRNEDSIEQSIMDHTVEHFCNNIIDSLGLRGELLHVYWSMIQARNNPLTTEAVATIFNQ